MTVKNLCHDCMHWLNFNIPQVRRYLYFGLLDVSPDIRLALVLGGLMLLFFYIPRMLVLLQ